MPGVDGLELQRRLAATGYTTPIIFITAFPEERVRDSALQAGAVAFLVKPFEEASLISSIEAALALSAKGKGQAGRRRPDKDSRFTLAHDLGQAKAGF